MRDKFITAGLPLIVVLLAVNGFVSYRALLQLTENEGKVDHTNRVLRSFSKLLSTVQDAETGQRGYLLTGEDSYLAPYRKALERIRSQMATVEILAQSDAIQLATASKVRKAVDAKLDELESIIATFRTEGRDKAIQRIRTDLGRQLMDEIRANIAEMEATEERILLQLSEQSRGNSRRALATLTIFSVALIGFVTVVAFLINRDLESRKQLQATMTEYQEQLEQRVIERTSDLTSALARLKVEVEERKQAERKLSQYTAELSRSNRELQDFAFVASHDLQEPLRKIQAFADRMIGKYAEGLGPEGADYLKRMQAAAERMQSLIRDLLTFSRVSTRAQIPVRVDLGQVTREVLADLEGRLLQTGGKVEIGDLPVIVADALQMRQLLQNLVGNALKFHKATEPPVVRVSAVRLDGERPEYEIRVSDNGIGFDEKYLDRIFAPFQRLHGRGEYEGTGMGLALCRRIVERHGGSIGANSQPGEGSTFVVRLPENQELAAPTSG